MLLSEFAEQLDQLLAAAQKAFAECADAAALENARVEFLGAKNGKLKDVQKGLAQVSKEDKPAAGKHFNEVKASIETAFAGAQERFKKFISVDLTIQGEHLAGVSATATVNVEHRRFDPTLPGTPFRLGKLHPITQTIEELKDIMGRLGFSAADGPEIEDDWHNFEALNIPLEHPARTVADNFYLVNGQNNLTPTNISEPLKQFQNEVARRFSPDRSEGAQPSLLLRSQTSTVQIRVMEATKPPIRIISLGRVYRPDEADETHYPMFHQMEGLMVDRHVTMADLKSVLRMFATSYLGTDVQIRFRPSFFPFTEPSVEVDLRWGDRWMEFGGAGMVDPNVLEAVGYDPNEVSGFAFGLGVERLCMRRHNLPDIRALFTNDVRFLQQF